MAYQQGMPCSFGGCMPFFPSSRLLRQLGLHAPPYGVHLRGAFLITLACINESGDILWQVHITTALFPHLCTVAASSRSVLNLENRMLCIRLRTRHFCGQWRKKTYKVAKRSIYSRFAHRPCASSRLSRMKMNIIERRESIRHRTRSLNEGKDYYL